MLCHSFSIYGDKERLDLVSVIRSFGNEVFKKKTRLKSAEFWNQVTAKYHAMGHSKKVNDISSMWNSMLRSAKLSWAQDREPFVGDKEIIEFMTEVIQNKDKSKQDSQLDFSEDSTVHDDSNNCKDLENPENESSDHKEEKVGMQDLEKYEEHSEKIEEPIHDLDNNHVDLEEIESSSEGDSKSTTFNDYDYVSLEDIQKQYGGNVLIIPKPTEITEVCTQKLFIKSFFLL